MANVSNSCHTKNYDFFNFTSEIIIKSLPRCESLIQKLNPRQMSSNLAISDISFEDMVVSAVNQPEKTKKKKKMVVEKIWRHTCRFSEIQIHLDCDNS